VPAGEALHAAHAALLRNLSAESDAAGRKAAWESALKQLDATKPGA